MSIDFGVNIPFIHHLGITLEKFGGGESELFFTPRPEHGNSHNVTHGGAVMTFLDVAMATASRSAQPDTGVVTIEMKTSFMRPAPLATGKPLVARGRVLHHTRGTAFAEGSVYDADGQLCAQATGTFKYVAPAARPGQSKDPLPAG
jgi:uncharacterized protein (TIGR00369 family)